MITGVVTVEREAIIQLTVQGLSGRKQTIEAVIDTGFDGALTLPPSLINRLRLPCQRRGLAVLADGSEIVFDIYEAFALWDKQRRRIVVDSADTTPLVGMGLLDGYELKMQVRDRGKVRIKSL